MQVSVAIKLQNVVRFYLVNRVKAIMLFLMSKAVTNLMQIILILTSFRLEMLQQIANRVQRDSLTCEDKLMLARNAVQSVSLFE